MGKEVGGDQTPNPCSLMPESKLSSAGCSRNCPGVGPPWLLLLLHEQGTEVGGCQEQALVTSHRLASFLGIPIAAGSGCVSSPLLWSMAGAPLAAVGPGLGSISSFYSLGF